MSGEKRMARVGIGAAIVALALSSCFKSTPMVAAPASAEETAAINDAIDSTIWYVDRWTDDGGKEHTDGAEVFVFMPPSSDGTTYVLTSLYRGAFHQIGDFNQHWRREVQGKNLILHYPAMDRSTRNLRFESVAPNKMVMFDYDFTRTYQMTRVPPNGGSGTQVATGKYVLSYLKEVNQPSDVPSPPFECTLQPPPEGRVAAGTCKDDSRFECTSADGSPQRLTCAFVSPTGDKKVSAVLRLNPDGALLGIWGSDGTRGGLPIAMFRRP